MNQWVVGYLIQADCRGYENGFSAAFTAEIESLEFNCRLPRLQSTKSDQDYQLD